MSFEPSFYENEENEELPSNVTEIPPMHMLIVQPLVGQEFGMSNVQGSTEDFANSFFVLEKSFYFKFDGQTLMFGKEWRVSSQEAVLWNVDREKEVYIQWMGQDLFRRMEIVPIPSMNQMESICNNAARIMSQISAPMKVLVIGDSKAKAQLARWHCGSMHQLIEKFKRKSYFVDLDVTNNELTLPGSIAACAVDYCSHPDLLLNEHFQTSVPLAYPFGHLSISDNPELFKLQLKRLVNALTYYTSVDYSQRVYIKAPDDLDSEMLGLIIQEFSVNFVFVAHETEDSKNYFDSLFHHTKFESIQRINVNCEQPETSLPEFDSQKQSYHNYLYGLHSSYTPMSVLLENITIYKYNGTEIEKVDCGQLVRGQVLAISATGNVKDNLTGFCIVEAVFSSESVEVLAPSNKVTSYHVYWIYDCFTSIRREKQILNSTSDKKVDSMEIDSSWE